MHPTFDSSSNTEQIQDMIIIRVCVGGGGEMLEFSWILHLANMRKSWIPLENTSFCQRDEEKARHEAGKNDLEGSGCP